jgi:S1-C subfamily serine protease
MKSLKEKLIVGLVIVAIAAVAFAVGSGFFNSSKTSLASPVLYDKETVTTIYDAANPAVVEIKTSEGNGFWALAGQGSGIIIDTQGNILTNNHVVEGATSVEVVIDENTVEGTVMGTDEIHDLAIVKVDASAVAGITPLQLGDSSSVQAGEMAIAIGSPYGLTDTVTVGVVSGLNRSINDLTGMIQTDATLNPGNSGGPLLNDQGEIIGINTAIETNGMGGMTNIGFAIPSNTVKNVLADLIAGNEITRPWLGISGIALTSPMAEKLNLSVDQGVYVVTVMADSPAESAGLIGGGYDGTGSPLSGGDVITAVDGKIVSSVSDISNYINTKKVGNTVTLTVLRDGSQITLQATLGTWPEQTQSNIIPEMPNMIPRGGGGQNGD